MRIACLRLPNLPLSAVLRAHPELREEPVVVSSGTGPRAEVLSVSPEASVRNVRPGTSVAQALAICSQLRVYPTSPTLEQSTRDALLDVALSFSPRACLAPPSTSAYAGEAAVFLDASGVEALFHSEAGFAAALCGRAERLGLVGDVTLTGSRDASLALARQLATPPGTAGMGSVQIVPPGDEPFTLASLPIDVLAPSQALAQTLTRLGVHRVSDLLDLPRTALSTRLGPEVDRLFALARGERSEVPLPVPETPRAVESFDLEFPIERLEPLSFALHRVLGRLCERLQVRHLACGDLELELRLDIQTGPDCDRRRVGVPAPTSDPGVLLRLLSRSLETRPPTGPVLGLSLGPVGRPAHTAQLDLFRPAGPAPDTLGRTLGALEALCGEGRLGTPLVADDHHPAAYGISPFQAVHASSVRSDPSPPYGPGLSLALRALRPPVPAQVQLQQGVPSRVRSGVANGTVLGIAGPWRTTGGWWSQRTRYAYDSFDVLTSDGTLARLRFDHVGKSWEVDAVYD